MRNTKNSLVSFIVISYKRDLRALPDYWIRHLSCALEAVTLCVAGFLRLVHAGNKIDVLGIAHVLSRRLIRSAESTRRIAGLRGKRPAGPRYSILIGQRLAWRNLLRYSVFAAKAPPWSRGPNFCSSVEQQSLREKWNRPRRQTVYTTYPNPRQTLMSTRQPHVIRSTGGGLLLVATVALFAACGGGGGGDGGGGGGASGGASSISTVAFTGTAATGKALANATININCAQGSISVGADANGNYRATLGAVMPCIITATLGEALLHSVAFADGTYNVTPETDLLLSYLAAQLGTNESGLITGFTANTRFQQALASQDDVLTAQAAVVQNLQETYAVTLSTPSFLITPFAVGQPGVDSDLQLLLTRGAIDANGDPSGSAAALMATMGAAHPIATPPGTSTGGTGGTGTGGTGSPGGMGAMM